MQPRPFLALLTVSLGAGLGARHWRLSGDPAAPPARAPANAAASPAPSPRPEPRPSEADVASGRSPEHYRNLIKWLAGATPEELARMAPACLNMRGDLSIRLLMARWAEVDPDGMLAWAHAQQGHGSITREFLVNNAWEAWGRMDFDAAWNAATNDKLRGSILLGLTASDPGRALDILRRQPTLARRGNNSWAGGVLGRVARQFPREAAQFIDRHLRGDWVAVASVAPVWSLTDPAAAVTWAGGQNRFALDAVLESIAMNRGCEGQALLTADMAAAVPAGSARAQMEAALLAQQARENPAAALNAFTALPEGNAKGLVGMKLVEELTRSGHQAEALKIAEKLQWTYKREWLPEFVQHSGPGNSGSGYSGNWNYTQALSQLASGLAQSDPDAALQLIKDHSGDAVVQGIWPWLPDRLADVADSLYSGKVYGTTMQNMFQSWLQKDAAAATAWIASKPAGDPVANTFCKAWAAVDPQALVRWGGQGPQSDSVWTAVLQKQPGVALEHLEQAVAAAPHIAADNQTALEEQDPDVGARLLPLLPQDVELQDNAMHRWLSRQPEQAIQWVESLPQGEKRTTASVGIAYWYSSQKEYDAAWQWASILPNGYDSNVLAATWRNWSKVDKSAADAALAALSAERQNAVRSRFSEP